jgi:hypothetical protein
MMRTLLRRVPVALAAAVLTSWTVGGAMAFAQDGSGKFAAAAKAAFAEADADGSGELNADEFVAFHDILRSKLEAIRFAELDTDGSGGVSMAELAAGRHGRGHRPGGPGF